MANIIITEIVLNVGRKFRPMISDPTLRDFIEFEIPEGARFYNITELIDIMEHKYRLDFYDAPTDCWVTLPREVEYPYVTVPLVTIPLVTVPSASSTAKPTYRSNSSKDRKRGRKRAKVDEPEHVIGVIDNSPVTRRNVVERAQKATKFRVDTERTFKNPVPVSLSSEYRSVQEIVKRSKATLESFAIEEADFISRPASTPAPTK
jgi:hypothetical protein